MPVRPTPVIDRMWRRIHIPADPDNCWTWLGALRNGYGVIGLGARSDGIEYVHRIAYLQKWGFIEDGHEVCHRCNNRKCVNPDHLYEGTRLDNMRQAKRDGRLARPFRAWSAARRNRYDMIKRGAT